MPSEDKTCRSGPINVHIVLIAKQKLGDPQVIAHAVGEFRQALGQQLEHLNEPEQLQQKYPLEQLEQFQQLQQLEELKQ